MTFDEAVATMPKGWKELEIILKKFADKMSDGKVTLPKANKIVKDLADELNKINTGDSDKINEAMCREDIFSFVGKILRVKKVGEALDVLDENRDF